MPSVKGAACAFVFILACLPCHGFDVSVTPAKTRGGQGFLLSITAAPTGYFEVSYNGKTYLPYGAGDNAREIFLPVKIEDSGKKDITVKSISGDNAGEEKETWIKVARRAKKSVRLRQKDEKMRADEPIIEEQNKAVLASIRSRSEEKLWKTRFIAPLKAPIATRFALQRKASSYQYYHKGIDYSAPVGTKVRAAGGGKVIFARGGLNVYGNAMIIDHGQGVVSCYFHLSKFLKNEGDTVAGGEEVAEVGSTGWATGPHLHFGVYLQGEPVDPLWWIKFTQPHK